MFINNYGRPRSKAAVVASNAAICFLTAEKELIHAKLRLESEWLYLLDKSAKKSRRRTAKRCFESASAYFRIAGTEFESASQLFYKEGVETDISAELLDEYYVRQQLGKRLAAAVNSSVDQNIDFPSSADDLADFLMPQASISPGSACGLVAQFCFNLSAVCRELEMDDAFRRPFKVMQSRLGKLNLLLGVATDLGAFVSVALSQASEDDNVTNKQR